MATIGTFTKSENGYAGSVRTLTVNAKARFAPAEKEKDNAPDFRVFAGTAEIGAADSPAIATALRPLRSELDRCRPWPTMPRRCGPSCWRERRRQACAACVRSSSPATILPTPPCAISSAARWSPR
jgi:Protein of unknown function (DUF736)